MKLEQALQTTKFENDQHKALLNVLYTGYWFKTQTADILKKYSLTSEQFNVMRILKGMHPKPMCVKNIASRMIEKSSNVPRILDRMVLKGFAERIQSPEDKRETLVNLTEKGIKQLGQASSELSEHTKKIVSLTDKEAVQLNDLLEAMRKID